MGLDMWATASKKEQKDADGNVLIDKKELANWRKHNRLHGYMEQLWNDKNCPGIEQNETGSARIYATCGSAFNCIPLNLNKEDLKDLKTTILKRALPETQGFFFGMDSYEYSNEEINESDKYDLDFVTNAIQAIKDGYKVHYNSWW